MWEDDHIDTSNLRHCLTETAIHFCQAGYEVCIAAKATNMFKYSVTERANNHNQVYGYLIKPNKLHFLELPEMIAGLNINQTSLKKPSNERHSL